MPSKIGFVTLCTSAALLCTLPAPVQAADSGLIFYYSGGGNFLQTEPLHQILQTEGFADLNSAFWGQGFGAYGVVERVILGGEYQSLWGQTTRSEQELLNLSAHYTIFHLGYALVSTPQFQVYPYIGAGWGQMQLSSSQNLNSLLGMSQGSNPYLGQAQSHSWLLDLGLGLNGTFPMGPANAQDQRGPALGLRAGYLLPLNAASWSSHELPVSGGPNLHPGGFYLRLTAGFGAYQ